MACKFGPERYRLNRVIPGDMSRLEIKAAKKSFGSKTVLDSVSFSCETGEIVGLFGRNGSGKSTLLKNIFGTLQADFIDLEIDNSKLQPKNVISSGKIGYLPQESFLPPELRVREVIPLFFPKGEDQDRIFYSKGISGFERQKAGKLSSGQLRYLEIILLCHLDHPFLLLDEPFSMIEPLYNDLIKELLISLGPEKGIILTDHYYKDVLSISTRNFLLKDGKILPVNNEKDLADHNYISNSNL